MNGYKDTDDAGVEVLFRDRRVQLFLGKFLSGEITKITPVFDPKLGYRYPDVGTFIDRPEDAEPFLLKLERLGILTSEPCGVLICCPSCGSCSLDKAAPPTEKREPESDQVTETNDFPVEGDNWVCRNCGTLIKGGEVSLRVVYCYHFSKDGIEHVSDRLVVAPVRDFLHKRGYQTVSPGKLMGDSEVQHSFDIVAYSAEPEEGVLVIDFVVSDSPAEEDKVIAMFAKVFDTNPLKSILVAFPGLTEKALKLAEQYKIAIVETGAVGSLFNLLLRVIPPVDELKFETLDVMTLLSLPDHLRKTATVVCSLGRATAEEIAKNTNRARAVESGYLNQLVRMGYLKKERRGRTVFFSVVS